VQYLMQVLLYLTDRGIAVLLGERSKNIGTKQLYQHQLHIINNKHISSRATTPGQVETPMLA
jgi:hypothetical protein